MLGEILKPSYDLFVTHFPHRDSSEKKKGNQCIILLSDLILPNTGIVTFFLQYRNSDLISLNIRMLTLLFQTLELWFDPFKLWNSDLISSKHWNSDLIIPNIGIVTWSFQTLESVCFLQTLDKRWLYYITSGYIYLQESIYKIIMNIWQKSKMYI